MLLCSSRLPNGQTGWGRASARCKRAATQPRLACRQKVGCILQEQTYLCGGGGELRRPASCQRISHNVFCLLCMYCRPFVHCSVARRLLQLQTEASARGGASRVQSRVRGPYDAGVAGGPTPWLDRTKVSAPVMIWGLSGLLGKAVARLVIFKPVSFWRASFLAQDDFSGLEIWLPKNVRVVIMVVPGAGRSRNLDGV